MANFADVFGVAWKEKFSRQRSSATTRCLGRHLVRLLGTKPVKNTARWDLWKLYVDPRSYEGAASATIARELRLLRSTLRWAHRRGLVASVPAEWPSLHEEPRTRVLRKSQAEAILAAVREDSGDYAADILMVILGTAARAREILAARADWVVPDGESIMIRVPASGSKEGRPKILVATNSAAEAAFSRLFDTRRDPDRPFGRLGRTVAADYHHVRRALLTACRRLEMDPVHLHDLRRSAASWLFQQGAGIGEVAHLLGHASIQTTSRWYAQLDIQARRRLSEAVTSGLGGETDA